MSTGPARAPDVVGAGGGRHRDDDLPSGRNRQDGRRRDGGGRSRAACARRRGLAYRRCLDHANDRPGQHPCPGGDDRRESGGARRSVPQLAPGRPNSTGSVANLSWVRAMPSDVAALCGQDGELLGKGRGRIEGKPRLSFAHHGDHLDSGKDDAAPREACSASSPCSPPPVICSSRPGPPPICIVCAPWRTGRPWLASPPEPSTRPDAHHGVRQQLA